MGTLLVDDKDLDDAALWAVIDSAAASYTSSPTPFRKSLPLLPSSSPSPPFKPSRHHPSFSSPSSRPHKMPRSSEKTGTTITAANNNNNNNNNNSSDFVVVKNYELSPYFANENYLSPNIEQRSAFDDRVSPHCLSGRFPAVSLFKDYQDAAMSILEKSDYTMISGNPFIKKSGWRKIAFYFNVSFEIKDRTIEFDDNRNVQRSEFVVRAHMQGGRFSDGWGSCERREKKFLKPNNDIPSTAETRAKNRACQDLLGIGQYRAGVSHNYSSSR